MKEQSRHHRPGTWFLQPRCSCYSGNIRSKGGTVSSALIQCISRDRSWFRARYSTLPSRYPCPMFTPVLKHFHVSFLVRHSWYIKTYLTVTSHLLKKTHLAVKLLRLSLFITCPEFLAGRIQIYHKILILLRGSIMHLYGTYIDD